MGFIDREKTVENLETFIERFSTCDPSIYEKAYIDGIKYCILYIKKFAPEPEIDKQIGFDFSEDCQWK